MRVLDPVANLDDDVQFLFQWNGTTGTKQRLQAVTLEQLHDEVGTPVFYPEVVDGHDVGMLQLAHGLRFAVEAFEQFGIFSERARRHLDGDSAADPWIDRLIDDTHPTPTDDVEYVVLPDLLRSATGHFDGSAAISLDESKPGTPRVKLST